MTLSEIGDAQLVIEKDSNQTKRTHFAKKATLLSTALPGSGQIYNKKIWKAPIVWGGIGTCVYFAINNRKAFRLYKTEAFNRESNPNFTSTLTYQNSPYANYLKNAPNIIMENEDLYDRLDKRKRWLDLSYFAAVVVYGLNIIDANVDAHLFDYDISPDISVRIVPAPVFIASPKAGLSFTLNF
jgi:hypothetical protein